jgi:hypothetical protein
LFGLFLKKNYYREMRVEQNSEQEEQEQVLELEHYWLVQLW